jgi:hypothetical protein
VRAGRVKPHCQYFPEHIPLILSGNPQLRQKYFRAHKFGFNLCARNASIIFAPGRKVPPGCLEMFMVSRAASEITAATVESVLADLDAGETPLTFDEARKLPELRREGRSPDLATIYRWAQKPNGLGFVQRPGDRVTTRSELLRFLGRLTAASTGQPVPVGRSPRRRLQDLKATEKRLAAAGL